MDLLHLVDRLEELVASAQKMPIGSRAIIDRRRLLDIVDQMRVAIPEEVREAQELVNRRDELARQAEEEARLIIARAEEQASRLVDDHEITQAARQRAAELATQGESRLEERIAEANADIENRIVESRRLAEQQMGAADEYARELLVRLERQLQAFVRSVRSGIDQLEPTAPPPSGGISAAEAVEQLRGSGGAQEAEPSPAGGYGSSASDAVSTWDREEAEADDRDYEDEQRAAAAVDEDFEPSEAGRPLENLLDPRPAAGRPFGAPPARRDEAERSRSEAAEEASNDEDEIPPANPGVIDDFSMPQLDDEPDIGTTASGEPQRPRPITEVGDTLWRRAPNGADDGAADEGSS